MNKTYGWEKLNKGDNVMKDYIVLYSVKRLTDIGDARVMCATGSPFITEEIAEQRVEELKRWYGNFDTIKTQIVEVDITL